MTRDEMNDRLKSVIFAIRDLENSDRIGIRGLAELTALRRELRDLEDALRVATAPINMPMPTTAAGTTTRAPDPIAAAGHLNGIMQDLATAARYRDADQCIRRACASLRAALEALEGPGT